MASGTITIDLQLIGVWRLMAITAQIKVTAEVFMQAERARADIAIAFSEARNRLLPTTAAPLEAIPELAHAIRPTTPWPRNSGAEHA